MDRDLLLQSGIILLLLVVNGFLAASEIALISVRRTRLQQLAEENEPDAQAALRLLQDPSRFLATVQVGITIAGFFAVAVGTVSFVVLLTRFLEMLPATWVQESAEALAVVAVTLFLSFLSVVLGELVPKQLAIRYAEAITLLAARPLEWIARALAPIVGFLTLSGRGVLWLIGQGNAFTEQRPTVTETELRLLFDVAATEGEVEALEAKMLHRVFEFTDRLTKEVMTPRPEIIWLEKSATLADFMPVFADSYHARYPLCDGGPDQVIGVVYIKDVLHELSEKPHNPTLLLVQLARPAYFVPETKRVGELFEEMRASGQQVALLVDEFGGTAGLVTLKQLMEEIVGRVGEEVEDKDKDEEPEFEAIDADTFQVDGSMRIDEVNEALELGLPEGDYETMAGFLLNLLGHIPSEHEQVRYRDLRFTVMEMSGVKVEKVLVKRA